MERQEIYEEALDTVDQPLMITEADGEIVYVNEAFTEVTGYEEEEAIGKDPSILKSGVHDDEFYEDIWSTVESGKVWTGEVVNEAKDGSQYHLRQRIRPVPPEDPGYFIAYNENVDEVREKEETLELLFDLMVHDTNNDLNIVDGYLDMAIDKLDNVLASVDSDSYENLEEVQGYLETVKNQSLRMQERAEKVKTLSDLREVDVEPYNVQKALNTVVGTYIDSADVEIEANLQSSEALAGPLMEDFYNNLLDNAVNHGSGKVHVSLRDEEDRSVTVIENDGETFPEDFDIWESGNKSAESEGMGLGLRIVDEVADSYDIEIETGESEDLGGAKVVARIPKPDEE